MRKLLFYLQNRLSHRQFFMLSAVLVGLSSGAAAIFLKYIVHQIGSWVEYYSDTYEEFFLFTLFPLVGISLTVLYIRYVLKARLRKGSSEIAYSIAKESSILPRSQMYSHLVTSALTVGFGGSGGLESPMVSTGSAFGSNYGRFFSLTYKDRTVLLACGTAAGISAAFNSPVAGVLFAIEVLLTDIAAAAFIPIILAAACGALLSKIVLKEGITLSFSLQQPFDYNNVPFYILLGILTGFVSLYYAHVFEKIEHWFKSIKSDVKKVLIGGVFLCVLLVLFPPLFGEGYGTIKELSNQNTFAITKSSILHHLLSTDLSLLLFLFVLILAKVVATAITVGSGGNAGNFGPSLFVGAYVGFSFSRLVNLTGLFKIPESNFTLVAMAGILSGVFYAPLTAIFLIAEITGGYGLIIPLMIVSAISVIVARYVKPLSMEGRKLSELLKMEVDSKDKYLLSRLELKKLIETNFTTVRPDETLRSLVQVVSTSTRNTFPVVNAEHELVGIVYLDHIREMIFDTTRYDSVKVGELMIKPHVVDSRDSLHDILKKFDDTQQWNLPVVEDKKYLGFLSKASILSEYRSELIKTV